MSRRQAVRQLATGAVLATATAALPSRLVAADAPVATPLKGHINHSVCRWCYSKIPLDDFCKASKEMGIASIDLMTVDDFPTLKKHDLICAMVTGTPGGIADGLNRLENHDKIIEFFEQTIPKVADAGYPNIICFSGNRKGMSDEVGLQNCATGLKRITSLAEKHNVTLCMELLNSKHNHKDYMCDRSDWGVELCKQVGSDRFKLLYDIYHMQIMEGDVIQTIRDHHQYFAHYHTGGVPGRNELNETQELNYPAIMRAIADSGFKGYVAQEFLPKADPLTSLKQAIQICDV
ncbi:MAG: Xylose isomerase domain protein barrel [Pedosphaera sp.]|nr:Xylose isomerase domain protein barrel [Pedosphaera sp.]